MEPEPKWYQGWRTISGLVLATLGLFLDVGVIADLTAIINSVSDVLPEVVEIVGLVVAFVGRWIAKTPAAPQLRG